MRRISYYVHGRGRGHASRTLPIFSALKREGYEVHIHAGGDAIDLLGASVGIHYSQPILPGPGGVVKTPLRLATDQRMMRRLAPDIVISDGDMPSLIVARALRIPTIAIGHDLVFSRCQLPEGLPKHFLRAQRASGFFAHSLGLYGVAVHFLPIEPSLDDTRVARPILREELRDEISSQGFLLAYFRDQNGREAVEHAVAAGAHVVCFGDAGLTVSGAECLPFDRFGFAERLRSCSGVIGSAGSNLLAESVMLGKPVLALHRKHDSEQALNAELVKRAGVGLRASFEDLSYTDVVEFVERLERGEFESVDLVAQMPDTVMTMLETVELAMSEAA